MNKKLKIGDKFIWHSFVGMPEKEFTILGIDTSRPGIWAIDRVYNSHFHIQWVEGGRTYTTWVGNIEVMNQKLNEGKIIILNPKMEPIKDIKKFKL